MPVGERVDPYCNFRFRVEIDGITQAGFSEASMSDASANVIEYREGGYPPVVKKLLGRIEYGNITLKWGITESTELYNWWKLITEGQIRNARKNMSVILLDEQGNEVSRWNFISAWPIRYEPSTLQAMGNEVFIQTLEIAHEGMTRER